MTIRVELKNAVGLIGPVACIGICMLLSALMSGCGDRGDDNGGGSASSADAGPAERSSANGWSESAPAGASDNGTGDSQARSQESEPSSEEVEAFRPPPGGDDSIQTFGKEAGGEEAEQVVAAMRSFLRSLAAADYSEICSRLTRQTIEEVKRINPNQTAACPAVLRKAMAPRKAVTREIRSAERSVVYQVRVEGDLAFVLFTPRGGEPSVFVMQREGGTWKSTGVAPGRPVNVES